MVQWDSKSLWFWGEVSDFWQNGEQWDPAVLTTALTVVLTVYGWWCANVIIFCTRTQRANTRGESHGTSKIAQPTCKPRKPSPNHAHIYTPVAILRRPLATTTTTLPILAPRFSPVMHIRHHLRAQALGKAPRPSRRPCRCHQESETFHQSKDFPNVSTPLNDLSLFHYVGIVWNRTSFPTCSQLSLWQKKGLRKRLGKQWLMTSQSKFDQTFIKILIIFALPKASVLSRWINYWIHLNYDNLILLVW